MKGTARIFRALADPTRRAILQALRSRELPAGEIAGLFSISAPAVSRHLGILETAELVSERREGNRVIYSLEPETLALCLNEFISAVCPVQVFHRKTKREPAR
jgi:DNA-binding transcriptional ArsR family regulator